MDFSNELNYNKKKYTNEIEDNLYDVIENIDEINDNRIEKFQVQETLQYNLITDNGDVINDENPRPLVILKLKVHQSIHSLDESSSISKYSNLDHLFNEEKYLEYIDKYIDKEHEKNIDFKLLNPSLMSIHNQSLDINSIVEYSNENNQISTNSLFIDQLTFFNIQYNSISTNLILPQFSNSFQQLWSSRIYSPKFIDSNISQNTLSILWSFIILLFQLILKGFYFSTKIFRYNSILFSFCYLLGAIFSINAYFFIDFLLILICIISILVVTYEKWLFHYININELINNKIDNQYSKQIKIIAYGFLIGTMSTFIA